MVRILGFPSKQAFCRNTLASSTQSRLQIDMLRRCIQTRRILERIRRYLPKRQKICGLEVRFQMVATVCFSFQRGLRYSVVVQSHLESHVPGDVEDDDAFGSHESGRGDASSAAEFAQAELRHIARERSFE